MPALDSTMKQRSTWYRQTFEIKSKGKTELRHTLLVNPSDMSVSEPARTTVQQTLGGAYVSKFGQGLHQVSISGITGYNAKYNGEGNLMDGYTELQQLRQAVYRDFIKANDPQKEMFWYNWEDDEYYKIEPSTFRLMRSKSEAILYRYELAFTCLNPVGVGTTPKLSTNTLADINMQALGGTFGTALSATSEVKTLIKNNGSTILTKLGAY